MTNELTKIIVKIGDKSNVKFSHCKMYRAIMASELNTLAKANEDCNIVIIESISESEQNAVRDFAFEFNNIDEQHNVFFFIPDSNDTITSGIADELEYNIYLTLDDLYKAIYDKYNINVSVFIDDKKKYNTVVSEDAFGLGDMPSIDITGDIVVEQKEDETPVEEKSEEVEATNVKLEKTPLTLSKPVESNNESGDMSEAFQDLQIKYNMAVKDIKDAAAHADKLEKALNNIKEERDAILKRFNDIVEETEVLEDPITLAVYSELKTDLESKDNTIKDLEKTIDSLKTSIEKHKEKITSFEEVVASKDSSIDELNNTVNDLNNIIKELREKIDSGELLQGTINEYSFKIGELENFIKELHNNEEILKTRVKDEANARLTTLEYTNKALFKLAEIEKVVEELELALVYANEVAADFRDSLEEQKEKNTELSLASQDQLVEIGNLRQNLQDATKRMGLADTYSAQEKNQLLDKLKAMQGNIDSLTEQLTFKENQYNDLLAHSKTNSTETNVLITTNKNLDELNKSLREKLTAAGKELNYLRQLKTGFDDQLKKKDETISRLQDTITAYNESNPSALTGVARINYRESAQILSVFGSGSFGTTTTAMSLAAKLSVSSKVLFIDFDLVSPKADAWFGKLPFCTRLNLMGNPTDTKNTGLGIFYELGFNTFRNNINNIIVPCEKTKGGGLDYLSGVYYRVSPNKLSNADYSNLFNFLGANYQYIVVDLGRIGSNLINDGLIKAVTDISRFTVAVTISDNIEARNFRLRISEAKLDLRRVAWLLNMCDNTAITDRTKQYINPCNYGIMLKDTSMIGNRVNFLQNKMNKDKLDAFINTVFR